MTTRPTRVAAMAAVLFLARALATLVLLPPWQAPDEPQHASLVEILARGTPEERRSRYSPRLERDILVSMDRWNWWDHTGEKRPQPLPREFDHAPRLSWVTNRGASAEVALYHWLASRVAIAAGASTVDERLYCARAVSTITGSAAVFGMTWIVLGSVSGPAAVLAVAVIVFHPQLALVSVSGTPDALAILLATSGLWIAITVVRRMNVTGGLVASLAVLVTAGMLTKRTTLVLVYCLVVTVAVLVRRARARRAAIVACAAVAAAGAVLLAGAALFPSEWQRAYSKFVQPLERLRNVWSSDEWRDPAYLRKWFVDLHGNTWHVHGWVRYLMPPAWYTGFTLLTMGIGGGALRALIVREREMLFAVGAIVFQVLGVFGFYGLIRIFAQGRYLLPVLPMAALLLAYGVEALPRRAAAVVAWAASAFLFAASCASLRAIAQTYY